MVKHRLRAGDSEAEDIAQTVNQQLTTVRPPHIATVENRAAMLLTERGTSRHLIVPVPRAQEPGDW
jgi:hypothetical protein